MKKAKNLMIFLLSFLLGVTLFLVALMISAPLQLYFIEKDISKLYTNEIFPNSSYEIEQIVIQIQEQNSTIEKLSTLSVWIQDDFTWILNNPEFHRDDWINSIYQKMFGFDKGDKCYLSDLSGKKVIRTGNYSQNPFIIAYYKAGACGEHAALAQYLLNQSNFESRIVGDPSGYHAWLEIKQNETWYFYDPTIPVNVENNLKWFGPRDLRNYSPIIANAGRVVNDNFDITNEYLPYGTVNINNTIPFIDSVKITWADNPKYTYSLECGKNQSINLTAKSYVIVYSRAIFLKEYKNITLKSGENIELQFFK